MPPRSTYRLFAILVLLLLFSSDGFGQSPDAPFSIDVVSVRSDHSEGTSRLDVFTAVPHTSLRFLKEGQRFEAQYEVDAEIYDLENGRRKRELVERESWRERVRADDFEATQARVDHHYSSRSFDLPPGRYLVKLILRDGLSQEEYRKELITETRSFDTSPSLSDLILVSDFDVATGSISPRVSDRVFTHSEHFKLFYEAYADSPMQVQLHKTLIRTSNSRGLPLFRWIFQRWQSGETQGEVTFSNQEFVELKEGRNPSLLRIPITDFEAGEYLVRIEVLDERGEVLDVSERPITLEWADQLDDQGRDMESAIAQIRYIAKPSEYKEIVNAKTKQERLERFMAFWKKRDPTPGTPENERMQEYYLRIDYANRHYSGRGSGWETDQGRTIVEYGKPDEIERTSAELDIKQPYEVWYYHRIGRHFIFIDRNGMGQFQLMVPKWDERSVIR